MSDFIWRMVARIAAKPRVADWLIRRAQRTPYFHLVDPDGSMYMERWVLFNGTPPLNNGQGRRFEWLPSVRVHHICRRDLDRDEHNHPWDARTIILRGWYREERGVHRYARLQGETAVIKAETFHRILEVSDGGVWTLFIMGRWKRTWGFKTRDGFVPWRDYLGIPEGEEG